MIADAEANAEADRERKLLIETRNQAESLIHSTRRNLEEHGDKVDPATVEAIELATNALEETVESEDVEKIKGGIQNLTDAAMKLGQAIYEAQMAEAAESEEAADGEASDVVDADFEDVDFEQDKKEN